MACIRRWSATGSARRWKAWRVCSRGRWRRKTPSGKERSRNCTRRSVSWWWNGIFWRKPPADERGAEATIDRPRPSRPVDRASVRTGFGQPLDVLPGTGAGDGAEPDVDAAGGRAVPGDAVVWLTSDGEISAPPGSHGRPRTGAAIDGEDGSGGDLSAAKNNNSTSGAPDLSVSAPRPGDRPAESGLVHRHNVYSDAAGLSLSGRGDGLVDEEGAELAGVEHHGGTFASRRWKRRWICSAGRRYSTAIRAASSPHPGSPRC